MQGYPTTDLATDMDVNCATGDTGQPARLILVDHQFSHL